MDSSTTSLVLASVALGALLLGYIPFLRGVGRLAVNPDPTGVLLSGYAAFGLAVAALANTWASGTSPALPLALAAVPLLLSPVLLYVMHRRRTPLGRLRVQEGDCLPTFEALSADGSPFDSRELRGQRVLLKFYRGYWCPFCAAELRQFQAMEPELRARGVRVVALSKDTPEQARHHAARDQLTHSLLCDPDLRVIQKLGLEHQKATELSGGRMHVFGFPVGYRLTRKSMAIPTTMLLDEAGRVRWIDQSADYQVRSNAIRVREALDQVFGVFEGTLDPAVYVGARAASLATRCPR